MLKNFRVLSEAIYFITFKSTVRATAKVFGVCKSTVHNDLVKTLPHLNRTLYNKVRQILDINSEEKHSRGGQARAAQLREMRKNK